MELRRYKVIPQEVNTLQGLLTSVAHKSHNLTVIGRQIVAVDFDPESMEITFMLEEEEKGPWIQGQKFI